jgi:hypothetical protein
MSCGGRGDFCWRTAGTNDGKQGLASTALNFDVCLSDIELQSRNLGTRKIIYSSHAPVSNIGYGLNDIPLGWYHTQ